MTTAKPRPRFYPPVDIDPKNEIRVLELLPGDLDDEICCELTTRPLLPIDDEESLATLPQHTDLDFPYEALSYTWGRRNNDVPLRLNGFDDFLVTPNLRAGLRRLRLPDRKRRLWADQICINQLNTLERNHQVAVMGKIFNQAARVLVWLGEPTESPPLGLTEPVCKLLQATPCPEEMKYLTEHDLLFQDGSWWTRSWVVQEFALATKEPLLCFGPYQVDWSMLTHQAWDNRTGLWPIAAFSRVLDTGEKLAGIRDLSRRNQCTILSLGWPLLETKCLNPKDKLYSLIALLSPAERDAINVDYAQDTWETFTAATHALLNANKSYGLMYLTRSMGAKFQLPSWAVDFSMSGSGTWFHESSKILFSQKPRPWLAKQCSTTLHAQYGKSTRSLLIKGLLFDRVVCSISLVWPYGGPTAFQPGRLDQLRCRWYRYVRHRRHREQLKAVLDIDKLFGSLSSTSGIKESASVAFGVDVNSCVKALKALPTDVTRLLLAEFVFAQYVNGSSHNDDDIDPMQRGWMEYHGLTRHEEALFITEHGFIGYGAAVTEQDIVVLPYGSPQPMLLHPTGDDSHTFQGFAFVSGIMDGELMKKLPNLELVEMDFKLV